MMMTEIKIKAVTGLGPSALTHPNEQPSNGNNDEHGARLVHPKKYAFVWICTVIALLWVLIYSHYGADFTGISYIQFYGFICITVASFLFLTAGIIGCLLYCRNDTTHFVSLKILALMIPELCFCIVGVILLILFPLPNHDQFKDFVLTHDLGVFNRALWRIEEEMHCCGVDGYTDYDFHNTSQFPVPMSCCDITIKVGKETNCALMKIRNGTKPPDFPLGCFTKIKRIEDLRTQAPAFFQLMQNLRYFSIILLPFSILYIIIVLMYFCPSYREYLMEQREIKLYMDQLETVTTGEEISPHTETNATTLTPISGQTTATTATLSTNTESNHQPGRTQPPKTPPNSEAESVAEQAATAPATEPLAVASTNISSTPAPSPHPVDDDAKRSSMLVFTATTLTRAASPIAETDVSASTQRISTATETRGGSVNRFPTTPSPLPAPAPAAHITDSTDSESKFFPSKTQSSNI